MQNLNTNAIPIVIEAPEMVKYNDTDPNFKKHLGNASLSQMQKIALMDITHIPRKMLSMQYAQ